MGPAIRIVLPVVLLGLAPALPARAAGERAAESSAHRAAPPVGPGAALSGIAAWVERSAAEAQEAAALAQRRAGSPLVKLLAARVARERAALDAGAERLAASRGAEAERGGTGAGQPSGPGDERAQGEASGLAELAALSGGAFDQNFLVWLSLKLRQDASAAAAARPAAARAGAPGLAAQLGRLARQASAHAHTADQLATVLTTRSLAGTGEGEQ